MRVTKEMVVAKGRTSLVKTQARLNARKFGDP